MSPTSEGRPMQCINGHELPGDAKFCGSCGERALPPLPPAGWHRDPEGSGQMRWWDGARWAPMDPPPTIAPEPRRRPGTGLRVALALAIVVVGGLGLAALRLAHHSGASATQAGVRRAGSPQSASAGQVRSHNTGVGFGPVKLGMNEAELRATHAVNGAPWRSLSDDPGNGATCWHLPLRGEPGGSVLFDPADGLVDAIRFGDQMATSKGVRLGTPWSALVHAYPDLDTSRSQQHGPTVAITGEVRYYFDAVPHRRVAGIALALDSQGCLG